VTAPFDVAGAVASVYDEMVDTRRELHRRPELGFEERATTALVRKRLAGLGLAETALPLPTGAVFTLEGGRPGGTVVLRADMDALPVAERVEVPYASAVDGVMHACGHDAHTAALLGVARLLAARAGDVPGRYVFVFQPAEEQLGGAQAMLDAGLFDDLPAGARLIGCHVASPLPVGWVGVRAGVAMSEVHAVRVTLRGPGGHGAMAGDEGNVVLALTRLSAELGDVVRGLVFEEVHCVCSAGVLRVGTAPNVVPEHAVLEGTLRTFTDDQREEALGRLGDLCRRVGEAYAVDVDLQLPGHSSAVVNDPATATVVEATAVGLLPEGQVVQMPPVAPSDDVSEFLLRVPGCYFLVGAGRPDGSSGPHHAPTFAIDEACLRVAAEVLTGAALALAVTPAAVP